MICFFKVLPTLYKARYDAEKARSGPGAARVQQHPTVAQGQGGFRKRTGFAQAKLAKAQAKANLALAELNFTQVQAPFGGIVDRLLTQQGSLVKEGMS